MKVLIYKRKQILKSSIFRTNKTFSEKAKVLEKSTFISLVSNSVIVSVSNKFSYHHHPDFYIGERKLKSWINLSMDKTDCCCGKKVILSYETFQKDKEEEESYQKSNLI